MNEAPGRKSRDGKADGAGGKGDSALAACRCRVSLIGGSIPNFQPDGGFDLQGGEVVTLGFGDGGLQWGNADVTEAFSGYA